MVETEKSIDKLMRGMKPNIVARCESSSVLKAVVEAGTGVGILNRAVVTPSAKDGKVKILRVPDFRMHLRMFVIHHKGHSLSPQAKDFLGLLRANRPFSKSPAIAARQNGKRGGEIDRTPTQPAPAASSRRSSRLTFTVS